MLNTKTVLVAASLLFGLVAVAACKKPAMGACVVTYDDLGDKGDACTVVAEAECKDDMSPAVKDLASSKKKAFTAAKTCADVGFTKTGCASVPIAWSFQRGCPR